MKQLFLLILLFGFQNSCTSSKKINEFSDLGKCEEAVVELQKGAITRNIVSSSGEVTGTVFSYAATGIGYTTDVVVLVSEYAVVTASVCGLDLALHSASKGNGGGQLCGNTLVRALPKMPNPKLGRKISQATKGWKCPNLDPLSKKLRRIAGCYAGRKNKDDLNVAITQVRNLKNEETFYTCLSENEKSLLDNEILDYEEKYQRI